MTASQHRSVADVVRQRGRLSHGAALRKLRSGRIGGLRRGHPPHAVPRQGDLRGARGRLHAESKQLPHLQDVHGMFVHVHARLRVPLPHSRGPAGLAPTGSIYDASRSSSYLLAA